MTPKEIRLAAKLLELASDEFANHGCNDMDLSLVVDWTPAERDDAARAFTLWNGDPENERMFGWITDTSWMSYLAARLETLAADLERASR